MSTRPELAYLDAYLAPFLPALSRPDVTDIYVNRPSELWLETMSGVAERQDAPALTDALLWRLARQVAALTHQGVSREHPLLSAMLPGGARFQLVAPPATRGHLALAIRKHVVANLSLAAYADNGGFAETRLHGSASPDEEGLTALYRQGDVPTFLAAAVRARKTILISGGTSTGKTTFLNALLGEIPATERLILIEDTPEIMPPHPNVVGLVAVRGELGEARVSTTDLLEASLRMRPDRIILGELRGAEAFTFVRAVNTGHPGSITTIHADSPSRALEQLALLVLQSGVNLRRSEVLDYVGSVIDVFVQLGRVEGRRAVTQVMTRADMIRSNAAP